MSEFGELLGCNQKQTLEFFALNLADVVSPSTPRPEVLYAASILAHYAQVSTSSSSDFPAPRDLSDIFDNFVVRYFDVSQQRTVLEIAGCQSLLAAGFFRDQLERRHNIRWYQELGSGFFHAAGDLYSTSSPNKSSMMMAMSVNFKKWSDSYHKLSREFSDSRLILPNLKPNKKPS